MGKGNQPPLWQYSEEFSSPESYFEAADSEISSFEGLTKTIEEIRQNNELLLWRGQENSKWGLHSSLFRELARQRGNYLSGKDRVSYNSIGHQNFPTEEDMVTAESKILSIARKNWRFDSQTALEILARIQHHGGPTRLIDFSFNPYIAAWFATASNKYQKESGRMFALATHGPAPEAPESRVMLNAQWGGYELAWHSWENNRDRELHHWGDGSLRRFWVPPVYEERLLAQNAVFVLDGVPISGMKIQSSFPKPNSKKSNDNWKMADLLTSGSLYMKLVKSGQPNKSKVRNLASTYTLRITPKGKKEIREKLETLFGYSDSTIYPDIEGLTKYLREMLGGSGV